ncbi:hypothetical protein ABN034_33270 [Actinopolymorpha sp. B11F2]|uniref:hypothetical protein n=1 Tax=Actinopolymorpha sp. B11F2 TaxID=3160862 RepID=UPI0032E3DDDC
MRGRRDVLRLGAGLGGVLATSALWDGLMETPALGSEGAPRVQPEILDNGKYPIGLWVAPPPEETTNARYAEIADAGFTFVIGIDGCGGFCQPGETTTVDNAPMLNAAAANGLQALVFDRRIGHIQNSPPEQWRDIISTTLREYDQFPAFAGFDIRDEPHASLFRQIGAVNDVLREFDPSVLGYVNLFPTYANSDQLGTPTYEEHLDRYVTEAHPDFISFDHYPLLGPSPAIRGDYFHNWVLVRRQALQSGLPTWVFILACSHYGYRLPTEAELLWQINVSLAYGCKGIQYFTYWTPPLDGFYEALVTVDGRLTPLYYAAQRVNNDHLQPVGRQLLPLTSESVTHFGEAEPPMSVEVFHGDDWVTSASGGAVILGRFRDPLRPLQRWLLVVNRAFDAAATTTLTLDRRVDAVFEFNPSLDLFTPVHVDNPAEAGELSVHIAAGASRLYRLHDDQGAVR